MAHAASSGGAATLSLEGPVVLTDSGLGETALGAAVFGRKMRNKNFYFEIVLKMKKIFENFGFLF